MHILTTLKLSHLPQESGHDMAGHIKKWRAESKLSLNLGTAYGTSMLLEHVGCLTVYLVACGEVYPAPYTEIKEPYYQMDVIRILVAG